jgi:VCBS repeat protein
MPRARRRFDVFSLLVAGVLSVATPTRPVTAQPFLTGPWLATGQIDVLNPPPGGFRGDSAEIITGPGIGGPPLVRIFRVTQVPPSSGDLVGPGFLAYDAGFLGGVRVATCDLDPAAVPFPPVLSPVKILTGPGPGMEPRVRVFSVDPEGLNPAMLADFLAFDPDFTGGVSVACGDVNGDGVDEIVVGTGWGDGALVRVFQSDLVGAWTLLMEFTAFDPAPLGGIRVAAGDLDEDGRAEIIVGRASGSARVRVFRVVALSGGQFEPQQVFDFLAFNTPLLRLGAGGVFVASVRLGNVSRKSIIAGSGWGFPDRIRTFRIANGSLVTTLDLPISARRGVLTRTGIVVTGGTLTAAIDNEIVFDRFAGGSTRVRSVFFIGTAGRVNFEAY